MFTSPPPVCSASRQQKYSAAATSPRGWSISSTVSSTGSEPALTTTALLRAHRAPRLPRPIAVVLDHLGRGSPWRMAVASESESRPVGNGQAEQGSSARLMTAVAGPLTLAAGLAVVANQARGTTCGRHRPLRVRARRTHPPATARTRDSGTPARSAAATRCQEPTARLPRSAPSKLVPTAGRYR